MLNEVLCENEQCFKGECTVDEREHRAEVTSIRAGHGRCVQRYMQMRVLVNEGTAACQNWRPKMIAVRSCCDCAVSEESVLNLFVV